MLVLVFVIVKLTFSHDGIHWSPCKTYLRSGSSSFPLIGVAFLTTGSSKVQNSDLCTTKWIQKKTLYLRTNFGWLLSPLPYSGDHGRTKVPGQNPSTGFLHLPAGERYWIEAALKVKTTVRLVSLMPTWLCCVCLAYSNEDQLLWTPAILPVQEVEDFLIYAQRPHGQRAPAGARSHGAMVRDNEQVMWEWYQPKRCGGMSSEASKGAGIIFLHL